MDTRLIAKKKQLESWAAIIHECKNSVLDSLRAIERVIYKNPTIDKDSYPALDDCEAELLEMDSLTFDYGVGNLCSVYIREFKDSWFVDVYYFRCHDDILTLIKNT